MRSGPAVTAELATLPVHFRRTAIVRLVADLIGVWTDQPNSTHPADARIAESVRGSLVSLAKKYGGLPTPVV